MDEETIKQVFIKALNILGKERDLIIVGFEEIKDSAFLTDELEAEAGRLNGEMNAVAELMQKCIDENARVAQDQEEYGKRYDALVQKFDAAKAKLDETQAEITKRQAQRQMMENFMKVLAPGTPCATSLQFTTRMTSGLPSITDWKSECKDYSPQRLT